MSVSDLEAWRDHVALVTGASSGIGRAVTLDLLRAGMRVAACARRVDRVRELAGELDGEAGQRLLPLAVDLRRTPDVEAMFADVRSRWGGVDVLINNAGLGYRSPLLDGDTERWREMFEVNVLALCVCTREAVQDMRARGVAGHVIHIASMAGHRVPPMGGVYSATKHAVLALTEGLRQELRAAESDIRVTAVSPGFVETGFAAVYHSDEAMAAETYGRFPCLQPEDVSRAVCYVLAQPPHVQLHDVLMRPTRQPT